MDNTLTFSQNCANLVMDSEGFVPHPYVDPASGGEPITIAFGSTHYCDGTKVTMSDSLVSQEDGEAMLLCTLNTHVLPSIQQVVTSDINQNQLDALGDFVYNLGIGNFKSSTLLKKVNTDSSDATIADEFAKWNKAGGKVMNGLTIRRQKESDLYFS